MTSRFLLVGSAMAIAAVAMLGFAPPAVAQRSADAGGAIVLAPHRAVYDLSLKDVRPGSQVSNVVGRMVYELTGDACDGYTQTSRFVLELTGQESGTTVTDVRSTTWEDGDGKKFRFSTTTVRDQKQTESVQGDASRGADGLKVEITRPAKSQHTFAAQAFYPVQHSIEMLKALRAGQPRLVGDLYDASEMGKKAYDTTANFGALRPAGANRKLKSITGAESLDGLKAWPVAISYYDAGATKGDALPVYEMAFLFYDNGVSRNLVIDYGEYAIAGDIIKLEMLDPPPGAAQCVAGQKRN